MKNKTRSFMPNKNNVYELYEKIADWYDQHRSRDLFEKPYLDRVIMHLIPRSKILDLGCGMGEPIAQYFIDKGFHVTGIDGSQKQIDRAKERFTDSRFMVADMRGLDLKEKFDCVIAWDSYFHLSQEDQRKMFQIFENHLNPRGILLFTSGSEAGEVWSDNGGENLYHASLSPSEYQACLTQHHFELITYKINDENCHGHTVWVARYQDRKS
jgi:cyclopropane fatty-acyl-phospholipid synthase-like methyltransferase